MTQTQILEILDRQKKFVAQGSMQSVAARKQALLRLLSNINKMETEICEALFCDLGKGKTESIMTEIGMCRAEIGYFLKNLKRLAKPKRAKTPLSCFPAKSYVEPRPLGSVLVVSPWNYPFLLSVEPMIDAIAGGNSVVIRPSSNSVATRDVIKKLVDKTFEKGHVDVLCCDRQTSDFLLEQKFDMIFFTGSPNTGKLVMEKASKNLCPVVLELGGKSPCIVDETANISLAARRIVFGKLLNAGQTCVAPDFVLCKHSIKDNLVEAIKKEIVLQYGKNPLANPNYPKMANQKQMDKILSLIEPSKVLFGGNYDFERQKIEPTLMQATFEDKIMQTEIFGPVLPILTFDTLDEVVQQLGAQNKPLALYMFSYSRANQKQILQNTNFGGACINDTIMQIASSYLPFGGIGGSGMGTYHGKRGFETFTQARSVMKRGKLDAKLRYQPHSKNAQKLIKFLTK